MRRARRHVRVPPDLTSLFDVLFIVIFVALIRAAALRAQALEQLEAQLAARPTLIARISRDGKLTALESGAKRIALDIPLLEHSPDPDVALAYLGDRSAELRICRLASLHLTVPDLAQHLVIIAPDARAADLPHALYMGVRRDVERCLADQNGLAVVVEPGSQESQPKEGATP